MALEVEEAFPSFSTERIRSKVQLREAPVTQRRLDYNVPLLSVRRFTDAGMDAKRQVWKLSAELSKEPFRAPGTVPFTWEHSPGRPKQPESPPRMPSSPSPPSTPSPPSARRASPASPSLPPAPPPLRPLVFRSNSSTLFAPPPPPPPPPPPLPRMHPLPLVTPRRTVPHANRPLLSASSAPLPPAPPPPPPPPPPPSHVPTLSQVRKQTSTITSSLSLPDHERMGAFRLVDPTEGFLRVLQARRRKSEPEEFLTSMAAEEAVKANHKAAREEASIVEVPSNVENSSCGVVDAIVRRFLIEHPDVAAEEEASVERQDDKAPQEEDQVSVDTINSTTLLYDRSKHVAEEAEDISPSKGDVARISAPQVACSDQASEETQNGKSTLRDGFATECEPSPTHVKRGLVRAPVSSSTDPQFVQIEAGHKQNIIRKQQSRRCTSSIAILESCRAESLQMMKSALLQLCRKAATASMRTLAKAKQTVSASRCTYSFLDVVTHNTNADRNFNEGRSDCEEIAVVREEKTSAQEIQQHEVSVSIPHSHPILPPRSSSEVLQESSESNLCFEMNADAKRGCTPVSSPKPSVQENPLYEIKEAEEKDILPTSPDCTQNGERGCDTISSSKTPCESSPSLETNEAEEKDILVSSLYHSPNGLYSSGLQAPEQEEKLEVRPRLSSAGRVYSKSLGGDEAEKKDTLLSSPSQRPNGQGGPGLQPPEQEEIFEEVGSRVSSARHVYARSLGGDEPNEFYDASSRFGSRGSTPSRIYSNRSMSKDWSMLEDFLDATSSPFETPRTSVSDIRYAVSDTELAGFSSSTASRRGSSTRSTSKLSKRVGKSLWVDTKEVNAVEKMDVASNKGFISGEIFRDEGDQVLNRKEVNGTRRKWVSGDQASSSTSTAARRKWVSGDQASTSPLTAARRKWVSGDQASTSTSTAARRKWVSGDQASTSTSVSGRQYRRDFASKRLNSNSIAVTPVFPSKCQKNRSIASASGLPQQIQTVDMAEMGWPLGISGFPPLKINTKVKEERKEKGGAKEESNLVVPLPPLPPSPAGGSWLRKALSTNTQKQAPSGLAGANQKGEARPIPNKKWEDIVKGSHVQPGHLRFSEELHHHPPSSLTSTKYYVS